MSWKLNVANLYDDPMASLHAMRPAVGRILRDYNGKLLCAGFTLNGNRTWAKEKGLLTVSDPVIGHKEGRNAVERTLVDMRENMSHIFDSAFLWSLSVSNLDAEKGRAKEELNGLFAMLKDFAYGRGLELALEGKMHVFMVGDEELLNQHDPDVVTAMNDLSAKTEKYKNQFNLAIGLAYQYEHEISRHIDILRSRGVKGTTEELRQRAFNQSHKGLRYPDVAIRTGTDGNRTSGGLIGDNTELVFFRTYWPLFGPLLLRYAAYRRIKAKINNGK